MKENFKRIGALIGCILLLGCIITTLVLALLGYTFDNKIFMGFVMCDVCLPILLWIYIWLFGKLTSKHTIASFDLMQGKEDK